MASLLVLATAPAAERAERVVNLEYPRLAAQAGLAGEVRLSCVVSGQGEVMGAKAVSGPPLLAAAAIENVRLWRFERNSAKTREVGVVYRFQLNGICAQSVCPTVFIFDAPNIATVETKPPHWQPLKR